MNILVISQLNPAPARRGVITAEGWALQYCTHNITPLLQKVSDSILRAPFGFEHNCT